MIHFLFLLSQCCLENNFPHAAALHSEYRRDHRRGEYGDERDPKMREFLESISPLNSCQKSQNLS